MLALGLCLKLMLVTAGKMLPLVDQGLWEEILAREDVTNHDVAAFVDVVQQRIGGAPAAWIHYGLTSTDVVDTAQCWALRRLL
jgi:adenylosuccinate lyase